MFNKFNTDSFLVVQKEASLPLSNDGTLLFTIDSTPINTISKNKFQQPQDRETKTYQLFGQLQDRVTQFSNLIEKITTIKQKQNSGQIEQSEEEKDKSDSDGEELGGPINRYFSDVNSFDVMSKGVCRRCKKVSLKSHFEKWCTEEQQNQLIQCKFCLGNHYHMRCTNTLCYKCNQFGHMAKTCDSKAIKCRRCEKIGHKALECGVIIEEKDWPDFEKNQLKKLKCLNCLNKGHVNCSDFNVNKFQANNFKDDIYSEKKLVLKPEQIIRLNHVDVEESIYSLFSEESPDKKRKRKFKIEKEKIKKKGKSDKFQESSKNHKYKEESYSKHKHNQNGLSNKSRNIYKSNSDPSNNNYNKNHFKKPTKKEFQYQHKSRNEIKKNFSY